jgi:hypothetical protein
MTLNENQSLDQVLEAATVVSWADLMRGAPASLVHIEYGFADGGTLDYLKFWSSISRGHWLLACAYWMSMSTFHDPGIRFENGYHSEGLASILELVMQHQLLFALPPNLGRQGLLQIAAPSEEQNTAATMSVSQARGRISSMLASSAV